MIFRLRQLIPSKDTTERIVPWLTMLLVIFGGGFALLQYLDDGHSKRVQQTLAFVRDYQSRQLGTAGREGRSIRDVYENIVTRSSLATEKTIKAGNVPSNEAEKKSLRDKIIAETISLVNRDHLEEQVKVVLDFFTNVAICARGRVCDPDTTVSYFGKSMLNFINSYCGYLQEYGNRWNEPLGDEVALFLIENRYPPNLQRGRFLCEQQRKIEGSR